jgi:hypothetical protein
MVKKIFDIAILIVVLGIAFGLIISAFSKNNSAVSKYLKLNKEKSALIFLKSDECLGCNLTILQCFEYLNENLNIEAIAAVKGNRKIELKKLKNSYKWNREMILNKGEILTELGLKSDCLVSIYNNSGDLLLEVSRGDSKAFDKIKNIIK